MSTLLQRGMILDSKWEIVGHIATRGRGEVYLARQIDLDRQVVVVTTISSDFLAEFEEKKDEIRITMNRFHRETRAMAQVRHPNLVEIRDRDLTRIATKTSELAIPYAVTEYVPGLTLRATMPPRGFGTNEQEIRSWIGDFFLPILDGIETLHNQGIVHRDIVPENIRMAGCKPKIAGFGLGGCIHRQQSDNSEHDNLYTAPEQILNPAESDARGDIYSLGKILYEAIQGRMEPGKSGALPKAVRQADPVTPFLKGLNRIIQESTAQDKKQRMPSVKVLRRRLESLLRQPVTLPAT